MKAIDLVGSPKTRDEIVPYMVEVLLDEPKEDSFLKVRETLSRIGIESKVEHKTLYQTAHILQKKGKYYICTFKTLFVLDGRENNVQRGDIARQNKIIHLLKDWGLLQVVDESQIEDPVAGLANLRIVPFKDKQNWKLLEKYKIGRKR